MQGSLLCGMRARSPLAGPRYLLWSKADYEMPLLWFIELSYLAIESIRYSTPIAVSISCALPRLP